MGSADQRISDVLADVQATFGAAEPFNLGQGDDVPVIGSLQLSETQSQSVDGTEPVTQIEDVPAQLAADALRRQKKVYEALERRSRALLEEEKLAKASDHVESDVTVVKS